MATAMLMYERVAIGTGATGGINRERSGRLIEEATKLKGSVADTRRYRFAKGLF